MKYVIDEKVANEMGLTLPELYAALLIKTGNLISYTLNKLLEKEVAVKTEQGYIITQHWNDVIDNILLTSDKTVPNDDEIDDIADELRMLFPAGKKPDTPYYWRCNHREVALKLRKFIKCYGNNWTKDEILKATRKYVELNRGNPTMRLSKYFILKDDNKQGEISELATILENINDSDESLTNNWLDELR